jgi:cyclophilin family peptidyl-prolyl cis-trans isomerase/HEAT repeat protein
MKTIARTASTVLFFVVSLVSVSAQPARKELTPNPLIRIIRYEDQRNWNDDLKSFLSGADPMVRKRAALAAGRIGDARAIPTLADMVLMDRDQDVRQMAAFALGEIELPGGAYALTQVLKGNGSDLADPNVRARAVEALGKIVAAMPNSDAPASGAAKELEDDRLDSIKAAIVDTLRFEEGRRSQSDRLTVLLALTAVLRAKPDGVGPLVAKFLDYSDPEIVATALNTMARLRLKDANERVRELLNHHDPIVRANAARVVGVAEHKEAFDAVLDRALKDPDIRVRASAIRALGSLKDARAVLPLARRGTELAGRANLFSGRGDARNELLEILTSLGLIQAGKPHDGAGEPAAALTRLDLAVRAMSNENILEDEVARARESPQQYLDYLAGFESAAAIPHHGLERTFYNSRSVSARAAGLAELARTKPALSSAVLERASAKLQMMLKDPRTPVLSLSNVLTAYAAFKPSDLVEVARTSLTHRDVIVRATAAELLGEQPPSEANTRALVGALPRALKDRDLNDAALAILEALGKQKNQAANDAIKSALNSDDHLIRRKAVALLKANGVGDFSDRIGLVKTRNTDVDYRRAIARIGKKPTATIVTTKGLFVIEFLPTEAPLTVDNFIQLAKRGYFNGQTIPRVVPNFVVQAGDPRGDQNGGPGYQIRCEINEVPYERAAVGMALSGKDTGGSQWFVTHSPQPHLDGGYTVFGHVIRGMEVVDNIVRGDVIRRVVVNER